MHTVTLYDNGTQIGTATVGSGGNWATSVTLSGDGSHSIVAKDIDVAGNTGTSSPVIFTLDTQAPTVAISTAGVTTNEATPDDLGHGVVDGSHSWFDSDAVRQRQPDRDRDGRQWRRLEHQHRIGRRH